MKLFVMQLSPPSRHSIPHWSKYSQHIPKFVRNKNLADRYVQKLYPADLHQCTHFLQLYMLENLCTHRRRGMRHKFYILRKYGMTWLKQFRTVWHTLLILR
jgi:hypothetical protein